MIIDINVDFLAVVACCIVITVSCMSMGRTVPLLRPPQSPSTEPTLLSWRIWPRKKVFPHLWPRCQTQFYRAYQATQTPLFSNPLISPFDTQVCHERQICLKFHRILKVILEMAFLAHCTQIWKLNRISMTIISKVARKCVWCCGQVQRCVTAPTELAVGEYCAVGHESVVKKATPSCSPYGWYLSWFCYRSYIQRECHSVLAKLHPITFYRIISGECAVPGLNATFCFLWFTNCVLLFDKNLLLGWLWPLVFVLNNILILGIWCSTTPHLPGSPPRMFLSLDLLWVYRIQHGANGPLYVTSSYSTWIFCRGVSGFVTDCPCGVWCRGLTTRLLHVGPPFGNRILNNSWTVSLT